VEVSPAPAERAERQDAYGNGVLYFSVEEPHEELVVSAQSEVEIAAASAPVAADTPAWETALEHLRGDGREEARLAREFALDSPGAAVTAEAAAYARRSFTSGRPLLEAAADLNARIHREFSFEPASTTIATPLAEVLAQRRGVCQDFAHLAIACLRSVGIPARYVSGYLETEPPPGVERLRGADVSHAWFALYVPGAGWIDFDPTNDQIPNDRHVTLAWGRDYGDVPPLKGIIFGGGAHTLDVAVDVERLD
jgi:transglutaminase-like putative cysteine protease